MKEIYWLLNETLDMHSKGKYLTHIASFLLYKRQTNEFQTDMNILWLCSPLVQRKSMIILIRTVWNKTEAQAGLDVLDGNDLSPKKQN